MASVEWFRQQRTLKLLSSLNRVIGTGTEPASRSSIEPRGYTHHFVQRFIIADKTVKLGRGDLVAP